MLRGNHLLLRALEPADADLLYIWENDVDLWPVSGALVPYSKNALMQYIRGVSDVYADKQLRLMIQVQDTNQTIGCVDLYDIDFTHRRAAVGILIAVKAQQHKGYATEAVELIAKYSFEVLHLHQVYCTIPAENLASIKLFERCGFRRSCIKKDWNFHGGKFTDELLLQRIGANE